MADDGMCRKLRYPTRDLAEQMLDHIRGKADAGSWQKGERPKMEQRSYYCWTCKGYHLTSQPQRPYRRVSTFRD